MERYRITTSDDPNHEQTWVLLPDVESAAMQAEELARREKHLRVRVYHEVTGRQPELVREFPPRADRKPAP